jgi:hypothetical protein
MVVVMVVVILVIPRAVHSSVCRVSEKWSWVRIAFS